MPQDIQQSTQTLDPDVINLAKSIRQVETGGDPTAKGASGEFGAYQFTPDTWQKTASKFGVNTPLEQSTMEDQNKVAYGQIKEWKDQGMNPGQIASMWNSGKTDPTGNTGVNKFGVKFDTPKYVNSVYKAYQTIKGGGQVGEDPNNPSSTEGTQISPQNNPTQGGTPNAPASENDTLLGGITKGIENIPTSALNLGSNLLNVVEHPIKTAENIGSTAVGGVERGIGAITGNQPQDNQTKTFDSVIGSLKERYGSLDNLRKTLENDPVGAALDLSTVLSGVGAGVSAVGDTADLADVSNIGEKVSQVGETVNPINAATDIAGKVISPITKGVGAMSKYGIGQLTGFGTDDIQNIIDNPENYTKDAIDNSSRENLSSKIQNVFNQKESDISDTGKLYGEVRNSANPIKVGNNDLTDIIEKNTGVTIDENGNIIADASSQIRNPGDIKKLQTIYDRYNPLFQNGEMTPGEFLNMRQDLAIMAKFEGGIGSSGPLENLSGIMRGQLNSAYRDQIPGLEDLDTVQSSQLEELKNLRKGLLDKEGNLTEPATNKIANAGGKGKNAFMAKLEELSPGISEEIKTLKTQEKIQALRGPSVGAYTRSVVGGGGLVAGIATGNPAIIGASIADMILTNPDNATALLRKYGQIKGVSQAIMNSLNEKMSGINPGKISTGLNVASKFNPPKSALQR